MKKINISFWISIVGLFLNTSAYGAAMSSYPLKSSAVSDDSVIGNNSESSNATVRYAMSTIKNYVLDDGIELTATSPISLDPSTGIFSFTPWASQAEFESFMGWSISGTGGGISVSSSIPITAGGAYLNDSTHVLTIASDTGYTQFSGSFTPWDTTPDNFTFTDETGINLSTDKISNAIIVSGINFPSPISVTGDIGYGYAKNGSSCTTATGTVVSGDTISACITSSAGDSTETTSTVTIGGISDTYGVTTSGISYIINENFEGAGTPSGWSNSTNVNFDYTFNGGQGAYVGGTSTNEDITTKDFSSSFSSGEGLVLDFIYYKLSTNTTKTYLLSYGDTTGGEFLLYLDSGNNLFINNYILAGSTSYANYVFSDNTVYYIKVYAKTSISSGSIEIYIGTSPNPTTLAAYIHNIAISRIPKNFSFWNGNTQAVYDNIRIWKQ